MATVFSADNFFIVDGKYHYDVTKLSEAHGKCLRDFTEALIGIVRHGNKPNVTIMRGIPGVGKSTYVRHYHIIPHLLIVDNTNITAWEMSPYICLALAYGATLDIVTCMGITPELAFRRNIHGVPFHVIQKMHEEIGKIEHILPHWRTYHRVINF